MPDEPCKHAGGISDSGQSCLSQEKYDELEVAALRNEMREWQGRRFTLAAAATALVPAGVGLIEKLGTNTLYIFAAIVWLLCGFFSLSLYAHLANQIAASYLKHYHKNYRWEKRLADRKSKTLLYFVSLHFLLCVYYMLLAVFVIVAVSCKFGLNRYLCSKQGFYYFFVGIIFLIIMFFISLIPRKYTMKKIEGMWVEAKEAKRRD